MFEKNILEIIVNLFIYLVNYFVIYSFIHLYQHYVDSLILGLAPKNPCQSSSVIIKRRWKVEM